jgi:hypothetical protein
MQHSHSLALSGLQKLEGLFRSMLLMLCLVKYRDKFNSPHLVKYEPFTTNAMKLASVSKGAQGKTLKPFSLVAGMCKFHDVY